MERPLPPLDEARLLPGSRVTAGPFLERRRMERDQAAAVSAAVEQSPSGAYPARFKSEPGDLRGIPVIGCGVGGVSPGTSPGSAIGKVDREREQRRKTVLQPLVAFA